MKSSRIVWVFTSVLAFITVAVSVGLLPSQGQERITKRDPNSTPKPVPPDNRDLSKYGSVQYDSSEGAPPNEERLLANQRYDNLSWVFTSVENNARAASVGRMTHDAISPSFPIQESSLVVVGEVVSAKAFLSNDRRGVYSEFLIAPTEVFKNNDTVNAKEFRADREGGVVIYPNGQRIMYQNSSLALPILGRKYLFFLTKHGESANYQILATYDVAGEKVYRLEEATENGGEVKESKQRFLETVRNKVLESL